MIITYNTSDGISYVANPKTRLCGESTNVTDIQTDSSGHVDSSRKNGLGRKFLLHTIPTGSSAPRDIRSALIEAANEDVNYGNGKLPTFDEEFCESIGGYPIGARLWYIRGNHIDLVESCIANNKANFVNDESFINGKVWKWCVAKSHTSGFPSVGSRVIRPFSNKFHPLADIGPSMLSSAYQCTEDGILTASGKIDYDYTLERSEYGTGHDSIPSDYALMDLSPNSQTVNEIKFIDVRGIVPFTQMQVFVCVTDSIDGFRSRQNFDGWTYDNTDFLRESIPNLSMWGIDYGSFIGIDYLEGTTYTRSAAYPWACVFNGVAGNKLNTNDPKFPWNFNSINCYIQDRPQCFTDGRMCGESCYYPLFTNSLGRKTVVVPVRKGQFVFLCMTKRSQYSVNELEINLSIHGLQRFGR